MSGDGRFRALIARGSEGRLELSASIYMLWNVIERMRGGHQQRRAFLEDLEVFEDFIVALVRGFNLEVYLGVSSTDAYGVAVDVEAGEHHQVKRGLKWAREVPRLHIWVPLTDDEAVMIGVNVDRLRASGRGGLTVTDMPRVLGDRLHERVEEALFDASTSEAERLELWAIQTAALEAQSIDRINVLAASYPHLTEEKT